MKTIIYFIAFTALIFSSCNGQTKKKEKTETKTIQSKEKDKPEITIKVNKHYDKKGNLVSFDSTYTSFYENRTGDRSLMDSLFKTFKSPFTEKFPLMNDKYFKKLFFTDSLIKNDFFHEDFFSKRLELNEKYMKRMMAQMDSVKNEFFKTNAKSIKK